MHRVKFSWPTKFPSAMFHVLKEPSSDLASTMDSAAMSLISSTGEAGFARHSISLPPSWTMRTLLSSPADTIFTLSVLILTSLTRAECIVSVFTRPFIGRKRRTQPLWQPYATDSPSKERATALMRLCSAGEVKIARPSSSI